MLAQPFCCFCRPSVFIGKVQTEPSSCATIQPSADKYSLYLCLSFTGIELYFKYMSYYRTKDGSLWKR